MTAVLAPCPGRVLPLSESGDPVFADEMVGPGVVLEPTPADTVVTSPIAGTVVKMHPHAFVVLDGDGIGILVHLGINTVTLDGAGFEVLAEQGSTVAAGDPMVRWNPASIVPEQTTERITTKVPVVVMDRPKGAVTSELIGADVATGEVLFSV